MNPIDFLIAVLLVAICGGGRGLRRTYYPNFIKPYIFNLYLRSLFLKIVAVDRDWQYPAITEKHAFNKLKSLGIENKAVCYIAFPWATYIDRLKNGKDVKSILDSLKTKLIEVDISGFKKVVTVCQHIRLLDIIDTLESLGITDVFWSHKIKEQDSKGAITIHPFPLFPTQVANPNDSNVKDILYSFVGARSTQWYLTNVRELILDCLKSSDDVVIKGREAWHYNDVVYKKQVQGIELAKEVLDKNQENEKEYLDVMRRSKFALCPSGAGPNSIRLWECVEMGIVPVILADTYAAPKSLELFESSTVIVSESELGVLSLDETIRGISVRKYQQMLDNLLSLKLLYGSGNFVYDIVQFIFGIESTSKPGFLDAANMPLKLLAISLSSKILTGEIVEEHQIRRYVSLIKKGIASSDYEFVKVLKLVCESKSIDCEW
jgi:hypothetical protein